MQRIARQAFKAEMFANIWIAVLLLRSALVNEGNELKKSMQS